MCCSVLQCVLETECLDNKTKLNKMADMSKEIVEKPKTRIGFFENTDTLLKAMTSERDELQKENN